MTTTTERTRARAPLAARRLAAQAQLAIVVVLGRALLALHNAVFVICLFPIEAALTVLRQYTPPAVFSEWERRERVSSLTALRTRRDSRPEARRRRRSRRAWAPSIASVESAERVDRPYRHVVCGCSKCVTARIKLNARKRERSFRRRHRTGSESSAATSAPGSVDSKSSDSSIQRMRERFDKLKSFLRGSGRGRATPRPFMRYFRSRSSPAPGEPEPGRALRSTQSLADVPGAARGERGESSALAAATLPPKRSLPALRDAFAPLTVRPRQSLSTCDLSRLHTLRLASFASTATSRPASRTASDPAAGAGAGAALNRRLSQLVRPADARRKAKGKAKAAPPASPLAKRRTLFGKVQASLLNKSAGRRAPAEPAAAPAEPARALNWSFSKTPNALSASLHYAHGPDDSLALDHAGALRPYSPGSDPDGDENDY
ncbi:uncharacterized protein V1510DRAFT_429170 [Dipodascopsis tothii]|uniref:uncharacterized protein n=1 Tax=Dipodascopsis tothii TaxID=44089 RepID=UPI0034CFB6D5